MLAETTVGSIVAIHPSRSKVFERFGIDYCCGGHDSIAEACRKTGVPVDVLIRELEAQPIEGDDRDWTKASIRELVPHILEAHHDWLKANLPRIDTLCEKVDRVHGEGRRSLHEVLRIFRALRDDLEPHLQKEEIVLFPSALQLEEHGEIALSCYGPVPTLEGPVSVMETEHRVVGGYLDEIKDLTDGFAPPPQACNTWRAAWQALAELDANTRAHVHLENEVLHPLIRKLEREATAR
ncbi:MAG TPA: iron-sulfur cluster repair di-iron protein [Fibrobacteria bacterium]|nr:iron-sulfur cluster repair di-iron protein [Fibrobacteria bacterium]HOX53480.1 iron-sulfur cluster repair di-iron protein [Fibrobacteria bacterium]